MGFAPELQKLRGYIGRFILACAVGIEGCRLTGWKWASAAFIYTKKPGTVYYAYIS